MAICKKCDREKTRFPKNRKTCYDCVNAEYNIRNKIKNYKGSKTKSGTMPILILEASKKILASGKPLRARTIAEALGSKNTGLVNYHFGSMNNLLMILDKKG